jgi:hypothetical protein|tara:strand:- start:415 stop:627 length:213 start_codon:yes stop_codon:yes gene_type:complete
MNEAQQEYVKTFYSFYGRGMDALGWTDDELNEEILQRAKSMRSNVDSFDNDRFTKQEWLEVLDDIVSGCR